MNTQIGLSDEVKARVTVTLEYDVEKDNKWMVAIRNEGTVCQEDWICELATQVHELVIEAQDTTDHAVEYGELEDFRNALEVYVDPLPNFNNGHKCKPSTKRQFANISTESTVEKLDILYDSIEFFIEVSEEYLKQDHTDERENRLRTFNEAKVAKEMLIDIGSMREVIDSYLR